MNAGHSRETAHGAFFVHQQRRVDGPGGIIQGNDQIMLLPAQPLVAGAVLVQHHADQRLALAFAPMRAAPLGLGDDALPLQCQAHEVVRPPPFLLPVFAVEMLHRPAYVAIAILRH